ncbi:hypothetical protein U1Q18_006624 [Sarracenia purpurea var. burkii]
MTGGRRHHGRRTGGKCQGPKYFRSGLGAMLNGTGSVVGHDGEDETNAFDTSTKHDIKKRLLRENAFNLGIRVEPQLRKCETNIRPIQAPDVEVKNEEQPLPLTPKVPKTSADKEVLSKTRGGRFHFLTAKEINSCIVLSESTRVFCSIIIAVLVVLSNINLPSNIVKPRSTIASRPLYILLLTDVTIVLIRLLEKRRDFEKSEEDKKPAMQENGYNWAGAIQILEIGLVFYQVIRALFIDCSFYMVVVICGLSLV